MTQNILSRRTSGTASACFQRGLFFLLGLLALALDPPVAWAQPTVSTIMASNSTWRFFRGTNEASTPPTLWRTNTFDDVNWETGAAPFYYGTNYNPPSGTLLSDMRSNYTCLFLRGTFVLTNAAQVIAMTNRLFIDDGFITWLNGVEVKRQNVSGNSNVFSPYTTNANLESFQAALFQINSATNSLRMGTNLLAFQLFNASLTNLDFHVNPELTLGFADLVPPTVQSVTPAPGGLATNLALLTVVFSESVTNVRATNLLINGVAATSLTSNAPASYTFRFPLAAGGPVTVTWHGATAIKDLAGYAFAPGGLGYAFTNVLAQPYVASAVPAMHTSVSNVLTQITVIFNRPVTGVSMEDFLINGQSAATVGGSNTTYIFTFPAPLSPAVTISWDANQVIVDDAGVRMDEASNSWSYTIVDVVAPTMASRTPAANALVGSLGQVELLFSEAVSGVDAADLLVNGAAAQSAFGSGAGPYVFQFPQPPTGGVTLAWSAGHNIRDHANPPNAFAGGSWNVTLNPGPFLGDVIINEFAAANVLSQAALDFSEFNVPEDWIELYNRGTNPVRLLGWALTDNRDQTGLWTFPDLTLTNGQYLVVYASALDRKVLGGTNRLHTNFKLNPYGGYLGLHNAEFPRRAVAEFSPEFPEQRNDYSYGLTSSNLWRYYATPTPGAANGASTISVVVPKPHLSVPHGYFNQPFTLLATCELPGATLRYTTDGSEPTAGSGFAYNGPLTVTNSTVLRITGFATNALPSKAESQSYLFLDSIFRQPNNPGTNFPNTFGTQGAFVSLSDYEMDPEIMTNAAYANLVTNALLALPVFSLMIKPADMWDATSGIYTHPLSRGPAWEKPCSLEFFTPDGSEADFQVDAGVQIQGNASREPLKQPKHPLKVQFKGDYGPADLNHKVFPDSPRTKFDSINLRSDFNYSWLHWDPNFRLRAQRSRDAWIKDVMRSMNGLASHNRFAHLYINGLYWGIYDPTERPDASFAAEYLGGEKEDYDVINEGAVVDGDITAYNQMLALPTALTTAQYDALKQYLDLTQFIDYMLLHFYVGPEDWGFNTNWYTMRQRVPGAGYKYVPWDGENILGTDVNRNDTTRPGGSGVTGVPSGLHTKLATNAQYKIDFADRVHRHFFNNGVLMPTNTIASLLTRNREVELPMVLESARWGDYRRDVHSYSSGPYELYTRDIYWVAEQTRLVGTYLPQRSAIVLAQLRAQGLYPSNTAPVFNQHGGRVAPGFALTMSATNAVYYTTNGSDPRLYGTAGLSPAARLYSGPVGLGETMVVKARLLAGTNWSALTEATFTVGSLTVPLRFTEILYNPIGGDAYEFVELQNTGPTPLDLGNYFFSGISFAFPLGTTLGAGQRLLLGNNANTNAFVARYPGVTVAGWFGGNLANSGETITLLDGTGRTILSLSYDDESGWPVAADGGGYSLEIINPNGDPDASANWRASTGQNGTPGQINSAAPAATVVLNEVMAENLSAVNHGGTYPDWIELRNTTGTNVNLTGWSLTDDGVVQKFVFPNGTTMGAGGYLVVWCDAVTNVTPGLHTGFSLGRNGDDVFLHDASFNRVDAISFGPQVADYSIGRIGGAWTLTTPTTNAVNVAATLASATNLVINEFLANSAPGFDDWIELFNRSSNAPVSLVNTYLGTSNALFQIRSLSYVGPRGFVQLIADERAGADHLDFKLPASPNVIILSDAAGAEVQRVNYLAQVQSVTQGRLPDGGASLVAFPGSASPAGLNYLLNYTGPVLNEVLARNASAVVGPFGNYPDYLELYNPGTTNFPLGGMGLSDEAGKVKFTFAPGTVIAAGGCLTVWCDGGRAASTTGHLNTGFSLSGSSGGAYLFNGTEQLVNTVEYGFQVQDQSIGLSGGQWRLLASVTPGATNAAPAALGVVTNLRLNEWMASPVSGDDWVEIYNLDALPVSLGGLFLTDDPSLAGLSNTPVAALSFIAGHDWVQWIADGNVSAGRNHANFDLDADGETLRIYAADFSILDSVSFGAQFTGASQGRLPDGGTNIVSFPATPTPEASNFLPLTNLVINEVLTHTDPPLEDAIEVQNTGPNSLNIAGWWISNSQRDLKKFRVAAGTTLAPGAFQVYYENQFNADGLGLGTNFTLNSAHGDAVYLSEADGAGELTGYRVSVSFGAAENGVSFGRFATSTGADFTALAQRTFGADNPATLAQFRTGLGLTNSYPRIGPVIINEIMYHPVSGTNAVEIAEEEFVELHNVTASAVPLFDPARATNAWQLGGGIAFNFSSNHTIAANGYLVLVSFDPATNAPALAAFQAKYGSAILAGPYQGRLGDGSDLLELSRSDAPQEAPHPDAGFVPTVLVDRVVYADVAPWPTAADGGGASLQRFADSLYGNEALNWKAEPPTAGGTNTPGPLVAPTIVTAPTNRTVIAGNTATFTVVANGSVPLTFQWQHAGSNLPGATAVTLNVVNAQVADAGTYRVIVSNAADTITSQGATLAVLVPPTISVPPESQTVIMGNTVQFNVTAAGTGPLHYQWRFNGVDLPGQESTSLNLPNIQPAGAGNYTVVITNRAGAITSAVAVLTVIIPPSITGDPTSLTVLETALATFTVSATGTEPLSYQWQKDGLNLPGANGTSFTLPATQASDEGGYSVIVTNLGGLAFSAVAQLQVSVAPFLTAPLRRGDGAFEFILHGRTNRNYTVEFSVSLTGWTNVTNILLSSPQSPVVDAAATNAASRFYRVRLEP